MVSFVQENNAIPALIIYLSFAKLLTFLSLVLNNAGFNLMCSNRPHNIFPSNIIS